MLQIYSRVYDYTVRKINSQAYKPKTYHEGKPLLHGTFVLRQTYFFTRSFFGTFKPLRIGPYETLDRLLDVTFELLSRDGSTFHTHRNHLIPYYPKEPL